MNMLGNCLLIFAVICVSSTIEAYAPSALDDALISMTSFFEKLKKDYELVPLSQEVLSKIDAEIAEYVDELKGSGRPRNRRESNGPNDNYRGIGVLNGFEELPGSNLSNAMDLSFFVHQNGAELEWFAATLGPSEISLFQFTGIHFTKVGFYPLSNGMSLTTDASESGTVLVISKTDGSVMVLRMRQETEGVILHLAQHLDAPGVSHLTLWRGMNQLYLAIASKTNISIYHWLGEHFDLMQVLTLGADKLIPFKTGASMHLAATGTQTVILKFLLQSNQFVTVQKLPFAKDLTTFYLEKGHQREHYLALSVIKFTIIYKLVQDRFVPFQKIAAAERISSMTTKKTAVLFLLNGMRLRMYQYDGWKFDELAVTLPEIQDIYPTTLNGDMVLAFRYSNGGWKLNRPIWTQKSTWTNLRDEVKSWCFQARDKAKRQPAMIPELREPVHILNGRIGKLHARKVNEKTTDELVALTHRYQTLQSTLVTKKESLSLAMSTENPKFKNLQAATVRVKCASDCKANKVVAPGRNDIIGKLARPSNEDQSLEFANVRIESTGSLPCPKPAVVLKDAIVNGLVNGIPFDVLQEDVLRVSGDQEVMGEHIFANLEATSGLIPLGIATQTTQEEIHASSIKADELHLIQGGILLPLNGPPVSISGAKVVAKARIKGPVHLKGRLKGNGVEGLEPLTYIDEPLELWGNYSVIGVDIGNLLTAKDLTRTNGRSLNKIVNEAVPLNGNMPVHLNLHSNKTDFSNVRIESLPKYVTVLSNDPRGMIHITGTKYTPNNLALTKESYEALPIPKLQGKLCAVEAIVSAIQTSSMVIDRATAESIKAENITGASTLNGIIIDTATSTKDLSLGPKNFIGNVKVKKANLLGIADIDFEGLLASMVRWIEPGSLKGTVKASNAVVRKLFASDGFTPPVNGVVRNLTVKGNLYVVFLNDVNITDFAQSVVRLDEMITLTNVSFGGGLRANQLNAVVAPVKFSTKEEMARNMGSKTLVGQLESSSMLLPYPLVYPPSNVPTNLLIRGSAVFAVEPKIENVNGYNLDKLSADIWMANKPTVLSNRLFEIRNLVMEAPAQVLGSLKSPRHGSWAAIPNRLLSRTKPQEISNHVLLRNLKARNVIGTDKSRLFAPVSFLDGLGENSLKKNGIQVVTANMQFQEIKIPGDLDARGNINGMNLGTDVVRSDVKENIVTGKKTSLSLSALNINGGLNFGQWYKNTLTTKATGDLVVIKGWKTFRSMTILKDLRVHGFLNGHKMENSLLKSATQQIIGTKIIKGNLIASSLIIDGYVNDVNLTTLVEQQLKKNQTVQRIRTPVLFQGRLEVLGDATVTGLYHGVELKNLSKVNVALSPISGKMAKLSDIARGIDLALQRRAWYWNKLELIEANSTALTPDAPSNEAFIFEGLGKCEMKGRTFICNGQEVHGAILFPETSETLLCRLVSLAGLPLMVFATSDQQQGGVWIYSFDSDEKKFHQAKGVHLHGATRASAIATTESLWIAIQLPSDTMILRYDPWGDSKEFLLPGSGSFLMEIAPTNELLIFRPDGVWRLGGIAGPRLVFKADLKGEFNTFLHGTDYYVQLADNNYTSLLKTRYVGN